MAVDISNVIVSIVIVIISLVVFAITYSIYRRTRGGSSGFKYWAIASASYLVGRFITLLGIIITQTPDDLLTRVMGQGLFESMGAFFVMQGMLFLASDLKVLKQSKRTFSIIQNIFLPLNLALFAIITYLGFTGALEYSAAVVAGTAICALLQLLFWAATSFVLYPLYGILKKGTRGWLLIYMGAVIVTINDLIQFLLYTGSTYLDIADVITSVMYAILLIAGFFLLDRSMKT